MPQIGWLEILIIISIAIIVVGPKDFPVVIKKVGSWIGSFKRYIGDIQNQVTDIADTDENKETKTDDTVMTKKDDKNV
ncbi:MAG: twin-arginine translocase subunit TatB [Gammaproteobacteria bacterium]|jgi:sec-independent protein translocase protein TatB|nr:twin-arginine translocase subunit TatB [Gammaproteobacteria bacterium]|tara:strand:+ start:1427 stop:1660 length:234 start_codon:yes stop_codon:yes gene_type:complete